MNYLCIKKTGFRTRVGDVIKIVHKHDNKYELQRSEGVWTWVTLNQLEEYFKKLP